MIWIRHRHTTNQHDGANIDKRDINNCLLQLQPICAMEATIIDERVHQTRTRRNHN